MKKRKLLSVWMCLLLALVTLLTACGGKGDGGTETKPNASSRDTAEENPLVTMLPDEQYDSDFIILTAGWEGLISHEEDGDPVNSVLVQQTTYLESKFNITMSRKETGSVMVIQNSHQAGGGEFDLFYTHPTVGLATLMSQGMFADLRQTKYQHLDQPWWNESQVENYTSNGKLYVGVTDVTINQASLLGLVFNRDKYKTYGFEDDLYDVVNNKDFTVEYLKTLLINCQSDTNGSGDSGNAEYGLLFQVESSRRWMWALGTRILTKNTDGIHEFSMKSDSVTNMCNALYGLLYESGDVMVDKTGANAVFPSSNLWTTFENGRALMTTFNIGSMYGMLRDLEFDLGYLPLPMLNKQQGDYLVVEASGMMAIPALPKNLDMSSAVYEGLAIYSYRYLRPAFINTILLGRLSEGSGDYEMLDYLYSSKFYDLGFTLDEKGAALELIQTVVVEKKAPDSAAMYLRSKKNLLDALAELANNIK